MLILWRRNFGADVMHGFFLATVVAAVVFHALGAASVVVPSTSCYALDSDSRIRDFAPDLVVRFCKDVETRSQQPGYVDLKRFDKFNHFIASSGHATLFRVLIDLAIRAWSQVYNGMTQLGYEKAYNEFSFSTEQRDVTLYLTAVASLSGLVQKPTIKVSPDEGLEVRLSGSGANGSPPTTLSPTMMLVEWRCEKARDTPYEVEITIPIENYDPIQFTLAKMCEHTQNERDEATRGWAIFGIISCISIVVLTLACCGGFIYRTRIGNLRGIDALPGISILSACLETASGGVHSYARPDDSNNPFVNQTTWERQPTSTEGNWRTSDRTYGSI
ncbi:UNVERIFIED_CONTAM: hypothetical protein Sangu_1316700 [Sesamum angustifolium]|uniref:Uncharacterized protein n=1 Tax=Sesamum angustifolium TaxID=2727405 RepID=A0AAW2NLM7_9LAMI